jgi:phosphoribosyl 1,2-cyclic phosphate phosphodiesterase
MKITILGSGTSTGIPMVGCHCKVCSSKDPRNKRTRASILIEDRGFHILIDTSTDLRNQAIRESIPKIDAVLFTHAHADHIHGIDDLRGFHFLHKTIIPCFASQGTLTEIDKKFSYIFTGHSSHGYHQLLEPHPIEGAFDLFGLEIVPIPLMHGSHPSTGFRIGNFAYLTDCSSFAATSLPLLQGLDILVIDALRYTPHPHHFNIPGAIEAAQRTGAARTYLTHLTHEVLQEDEKNLPPAIYFAYDGLTFEL